ncbi:MAG: M23 family metallopeptidase, partial [Propionibacteriaceae bacterium]|nr:M23 family metallopeptidase [Propionibacteriaceae bacterium]
DLDDQKAQVDQAVTTARGDLDKSEAELEAAQERVATATAKVAAAQTQLDQAEAALASAEAVEREKAAALDAANQALADAQAKEAAGQAKVDAQKDAVNAYARSVVQDSMPMVNVFSLFNMGSTATLANRVQWNDTVLAANQVDLDNLRTIQAELAAARAARADAQTKADAARAEAAAQVTTTKAAQTAAQTARDNLAQALADEQSAETAAQTAYDQDQQELAALQVEQDTVNARIAERARLAEEKRKADEAAAAAAAAAQPSSAGLVWPVYGRISSPYGYRVHPISGAWRFHDGLDIAASCGTPVKAAAAGVVTDEYYGGGYGYRLFIDHGYVGGKYLTTSYNHLSGYAVPAGTRVNQGDTVAYVGTTGNSTGCHLHFMVWAGGSLQNPSAYLP